MDIKTLQNVLYLSWIPKLLSESNDKWNEFPELYYSQLGEGLSILHTSCIWEKLTGFEKDEGDFWKKVPENWLVKVKQEDTNARVQLNLNSTI